MSSKPFAAATERNKHAILGVLREELEGRQSVLEIGSGTGQHAVFFARELPHLEWQTSDLEENHQGIHEWIDAAALSNVHRPLLIDVQDAALPGARYDAVFSANTAHIMSSDAVEKMFALVSAVLADQGIFALYGPFRMGGAFDTASNEQFHSSLQQQDPAMGIRDLDHLCKWAAHGNLSLRRRYAMPANNNIAVWRKEAGT